MFKASVFYEKDNPRRALGMEVQQEAQKAEAEESLEDFLIKLNYSLSKRIMATPPHILLRRRKRCLF